jgi:hypothetical protein
MSNIKNRPNKLAKGFTKHFERCEKIGKVRITNPKHTKYNEEKIGVITNLIVRGTTDILRGYKSLFCKKIKVEHPIDKGYFKEVYVLTDFGKSKLRNLKRKKEFEAETFS